MDTVALIGRIIYAVPLVFMGLNHFMNLQPMTGYAQSKGLPSPQLAVIASGVELIVGVVLLFVPGLQWVGGILIALFMLGSAVMMHNFWTVDDQNMKMVEMTQFMKNIVMGGAALAIGFMLG